MKESRFSKWLFGETDVMENILEMDEVHDESREQQKREIRHALIQNPPGNLLCSLEKRGRFTTDI